MDYLLFKSENQNEYLYSFYRNDVIYIHPVLSELIKEIKNVKEKIDLSQALKIVQKRCNVSKKEVWYYYKKLQFFEAQNYFKYVDPLNKLDLNLTEEHVEAQLCNIQHIVFELTEACNLNCDYCAYGKYYDNYGNRNKNSLKLDNIQTLLSFFEKKWKSTKNMSYNNWVSIGFYGGEPLLESKTIEEVIKRTKEIREKTDINFAYRMTTNGLLIKKNVDLLVKNDIKISISIDGNKNNNAYRVLKTGDESFEKLMRNIMFLKENYSEYYKNNVSFISVLHDINSYSDIMKFSNNVLDKTPTIIELSTNGLNENMKKEFYRKYNSVFSSFKSSQVDDCNPKYLTVKNPEISRMLKFATMHTNLIYNNYLHMSAIRKEMKRFPSGTCLPFERKIFLTSDGKILPCERVGQINEYGDVKDNIVKLDSKGIASKLNTYFNQVKDQCRSCYMFGGCSQCILQTLTGTEFVNCSLFKNRSSAREYFSSNVSLYENKGSSYKKVIQESRII